MNFYQKIVNNGVSKLVTEKEKRLGRTMLYLWSLPQIQTEL